MPDDTSGFCDRLRSVVPSERLKQALPAAADRLTEARAIALAFSELSVSPENLAQADAQFGEYLAALVATGEAAAAGFAAYPGRDFTASPLATQLLQPAVTPDASTPEPLVIHRALRDLRALSVNHGLQLVVAEARMLPTDFSFSAVPMRWHVREVTAAEHGKLDPSAAALVDMARFHEWARSRPLPTILCEHTVTLASVLEATARELA